MYEAEYGWRSASTESGSRPMAFMVDGSKLEQEGEIDIPQTLRGGFQTVDMTMKKIILEIRILLEGKRRKKRRIL